MRITESPIQGIFIIEPGVIKDARGYFFESYNRKALEQEGLYVDFVQDNQSMSQKGTLRGLHFQAPPHAQAKLVRVARGSVLDVVVDIRRNSPTYGRHFSQVLSDRNNLQLLIPEGFAHGFTALENDTVFIYKCSRFYDKGSEAGIFWGDKDLDIDWGTAESPIVSEKDRQLPAFRDLVSPF